MRAAQAQATGSIASRRLKTSSRSAARELGDDGAAVRAPHRQTLALELHERVADRTAADAERIGELLLAQAVAGREVAAQDRVPQPVDDLVGEQRRERRAEERPLAVGLVRGPERGA